MSKTKRSLLSPLSRVTWCRRGCHGCATLSPTVGETNIKPSTTYAARLHTNQTVQNPSKTQIKPIEIIHGEATFQFTMEEVQQFSVEEGLHQEILMKFAYTHPKVHDLRKVISKSFGIKSNFPIGQLEYQHVLIIFDLYEDYVHVASRSVGYIHCNGDDYQYRLRPWTLFFNPKEETTRAWVWISLPGLPPDLFTKTALLSIDSAVGKPMAIDKATHDKSRPSTARVKVELDMLDKNSNRVRLQYLDTKSGKISEHFQDFVYDNLPSYYICCKRQGHNEKLCRLKNGQSNEQQDKFIERKGYNERLIPTNEMKKVEKLQGDTRDFLNPKRAAAQQVRNTEQQKLLTFHSTEGQQIATGIEKNTEDLALTKDGQKGVDDTIPSGDQITVQEDGLNLCKQW
nr:uncharacterized protein LOC117280437 [Nicotiana tomentosiformis]